MTDLLEICLISKQNIYYRDKGKSAQFRIASLDERDDTDDAAYWARYPAVLPEQQERVWAALIDGFEKYRLATALFVKKIRFKPGLFRFYAVFHKYTLNIQSGKKHS